MSDKGAKRGLSFVLGFFVYGLTSVFLLLGIALWWGAQEFSSPGPLEETKLISVERGTGLNQIANLLESESVISNRYVFIAGVRILGGQDDLKAGEYEMDAGISAKQAYIKLRDHDVFARRITIREGLTSYEVIQLLKGADNLTGEVDTIPAEGSMLPETFDYSLDEPREDVVRRMQSAMVNAVYDVCGGKDLMPAVVDMNEPCRSSHSLPKPLETVGDVLTLASIVEKETAVPEERQRVAGVFINRLQRGIPLQTDPTVIYAITNGRHKNDGKGPLGRRLLTKDLDIDSPYNTYKYPGLPKGPIANPGKASIAAVLTPEKHDYIYFVADGTGGHVFSKTLAEHNQNVAKWRKIRAQQSK